MRHHLCGRPFATRARHYTSAIASLSPTVDNQRGIYALETIYALSSAPGKAGVAVVRISGDQADACLQQLSRSTALPEPRVCVTFFSCAILATFVGPDSGVVEWNVVSRQCLLAEALPSKDEGTS